MNTGFNNGSAQKSPVKVSPLRLLPALFIVLIASLAIPFAFNTAISILSSGVCALTILVSARKKISAGLLIMILILLFGVSSGLPMISIILSLIVGTGTLAWLIGYTRSPYVAIVPVLAFSITTIISKSYVGALLALFFVLPALALAVSFKKGSGRVSALARSGAFFSFTIVTAIAIYQFYFLGEINVTSMRHFAMDFTNSLRDIFSSIQIETQTGVVSYFTEKEAYNMALQIVSLAPAIVAVFFNVISFFAQKLQYSLIRLTEGEARLSPTSRAFVVSPFAGATFWLAFVVSSVTDSSSMGYALTTVCDNVIIILAPCLIGMGLMYYFSAKLLGHRRLTTTLLVIFVILAFLNVSLALLLVACLGAYASISIPLSNKLKANRNGES